MKKRVKKNDFFVRKVLVGLAVAAVLFTGCSKKETKGQGESAIEPLRLGVMTDSLTDYAGAIGLSEGIFEKHGLKVEVTSFSAGINTIDAVTTGQMDIGFGADFAVINRLGGSPSTPLRVFTGLGEGALDSWKLYARGTGIQKPSDLVGKSVVTRLGTVEEYWHMRTLELNGLTPAQVNFLPVQSQMEGVALIQNGSAVAMWANARPALALNEIAGVHPIADLSAAGAPTLSVTIATEQFLKDHQSIVIKYLQSMQEIYDFMKNDPQRSAEIVNKTLSAPVEQVLINLKSQVNYIELDQKVFDGLNILYRWMETNGIIKFPYDLHTYTNVDALKAAFPGRGNFK
jgi:NitT/TauT family transport system substrate-binding protein